MWEITSFGVFVEISGEDWGIVGYDDQVWEDCY